ncbi:hypothetical protein DXG01_008393 [Tephrocybe rancida]|nr:hypothetical protein DXG01_008393 [Tephrocybe rancida]
MNPPPVEIYRTPDTITIKLGHASTGHDPEGQLSLACQAIEPDENLRVVAELEEGTWSLEQGFTQLGQYLDLLGTSMIDFGCWESMTVRLPQVQIPYYYSRATELPVEALHSLRFLIWHGHRQQMVSSWLPFTPSLLDQLTSLNIVTDLSLEDCARLLSHTSTLMHFTAKTIRWSGDTTILTHLDRRPPMVKPRLAVICITSDVDLVSLLRRFQLPDLTHVAFDLSFHTSASSFASLGIAWHKLEGVSLLCDMTDMDAMRVRRQCRQDAFSFTHVSGYPHR